MPDDLNPTPSTPELQTHLRHWRDRLAQEEAIGPDQLDELQDHLEAELQKQELAALPQAEALLLAAHRVGAPDRLNQQFFDANPSRVWKLRLRWSGIGVLAILTLSNIASTLQLPWVWIQDGFRIGPMWVSAGYGATLIVLAWTGWRFAKNATRPSDSQLQEQTRGVRCIAVIILTCYIVMVFGLVLRIGVFETTTADSFGHVLMWTGLQQGFLTVLLPAVVGLALWLTRNRTTLTELHFPGKKL
ncbi:MAG: hypothetical protein AAF916_09145 [Planctomycetota bacterium]